MQKSLKQPDSRLVWLEAAIDQCFPPGFSEVHLEYMPLTAWLCASGLQNLLFVVQHMGLVQLKKARQFGPGKAKCPCVHSRRHHHHLPNGTFLNNPLQEIVKEACSHNN